MEILKEFGVQPVLLAAQSVNFVILLLILRKLLYKPVLKMLDERKKRIEQSLAQAEEIKVQLEKTEEARKKILKETSANAALILEEAKKDSEKLLTESRTAAKKESELIMKKTLDSLNLEKQQMKEELRKEVMSFVVSTTTKVLEKVVTPELQKKITEKTLEEMKK